MCVQVHCDGCIRSGNPPAILPFDFGLPLGVESPAEMGFDFNAFVAESVEPHGWVNGLWEYEPGITNHAGKTPKPLLAHLCPSCAKTVKTLRFKRTPTTAPKGE